MFASTILFRRLFTKRPSPEELDFHWWFLVCGGIQEWHRYLAAHGFIISRRNRIIRKQESIARRTLETWDTDRYHLWVTTKRSPLVCSGPIIDPEILPHVAGHGIWGKDSDYHAHHDITPTSTALEGPTHPPHFFI